MVRSLAVFFFDEDFDTFLFVRKFLSAISILTVSTINVGSICQQL